MENSDHPYARALETGALPYPTPCNFLVDDVELVVNEDGAKQKFARFAVASSNGVYVFFADRDASINVARTLLSMTHKWDTENNGGLVVADNIDLQKLLKEQGKNGQAKG